MSQRDITSLMIFLLAYEEWLAADDESADLAAITDHVTMCLAGAAPHARRVPGAGS